MKIKLKLINMLLICIFFCSCSNNKNNSNDIVSLKVSLKKSLITYFTTNLDLLENEIGGNISIDSIEILKIDTLTEKTILIYKYNLLLDEIETNSKIMKLEIEKIRLQKEIGVYENRTLKELAENDIKEMQYKMNREKQKLDSLNTLINQNPDSLIFKYYGVTSKVTLTAPDLTQMSKESYLILTPEFKVKRIEDL